MWVGEQEYDVSNPRTLLRKFPLAILEKKIRSYIGSYSFQEAWSWHVVHVAWVYGPVICSHSLLITVWHVSRSSLAFSVLEHTESTCIAARLIHVLTARSRTMQVGEQGHD